MVEKGVEGEPRERAKGEFEGCCKGSEPGRLSALGIALISRLANSPNAPSALRRPAARAERQSSLSALLFYYLLAPLKTYSSGTEAEEPALVSMSAPLLLPPNEPAHRRRSATGESQRTLQISRRAKRSVQRATSKSVARYEQLQVKRETVKVQESPRAGASSSLPWTAPRSRLSSPPCS